MPYHCVRVPMPGGGFALARTQAFPCRTCGAWATKQCDYPRRPRPSRARCNAHMCAEHSVNVGPDLDWCVACAEADAVAGAA